MIRNFTRLIPYKNFFVKRANIRFCSAKAEPDSKDHNLSSAAPVHKIHLSKFNKRLLVMLKYYDSLDKVPAAVSADTLDKARSQMRIRLSNILMGLTLVACLIVVWWGKKKAQRGDTIPKKIREKNMKILEDYKKEQEALQQKSQ